MMIDNPTMQDVSAGNMPGKWQLLIYLGQQAILKQQQGEAANCS